MKPRAHSPSTVSPQGRASGFTLYEVIIVASLVGFLLSATTTLFSTNNNLASETRAHQLAEAAHRQNHAAIARVLRGIDIQTLSGFSGGVATAPSFRRVTGMSTGDLTYKGDETLLWVEAPIAVNGVEKAGAIYLERGGARTLVADRVPRGGFQVTQEGQSLVVELTTYYSTSSGSVVSKTSESVISIRN